MTICGLLTEKHIVLELEPGSKEAVLEAFVKVLHQRGLIDRPDHILRELLKREGLGSTGLERGIAVPHALIEGRTDPFLALAVIRDGIDFDAVDQLPTHVLLMLLGGKDHPGSQLKVLAHICRLVKETELVAQITRIDSVRDICRIVEEEEKKIV